MRHWLHYGCYKAESYGAMEIIRPCPSHIICSQMADFKKKGEQAVKARNAAYT